MKVKLDDIRVDTFATGEVPTLRQGTVRAHEATSYTCRWSCTPYYTCPECAYPVMPERQQED
ncbi:MAG TPA: hypothetical protein VF771_03320 [Longimicrobiaceae bacterium]